MKIRPEQREPFREELMARYVERMTEHLHGRCPKQTGGMNDEELRDHVRAGIAQANRYEITDANDTRRFLEYWTRYGPQFGHSPESRWAQTYLADENLNGTQKMHRIDDHYVFVVHGARPQ